MTCDVCQESCRNRADYVTHIKQHIEAGEKMGPDGLQPDIKEKIETESEEEEEEEQYSDGDDDYEPPAYVVKKLPKSAKPPSESDDEPEREKEERKDQVVFVRGKDGTIVKKTIKTLMPIQRQETRSSPKSTTQTTRSSVKREDSPKTGRGVDDTEAEVQKIVASVFKEHKLPLKTESPPEKTEVRQVKEELKEPAGVPKVNTVKVIKRIVVRKPGGTETTTTTTKEIKEPEVKTPVAPPGSKVTKRVIVRRIIRQGDTTREVIMNPDGTIIDPAELAKLPTGTVVKRVVVKKPIDKSQLQVLQNESRSALPESPKFELKTSQASASSSSSEKPVPKIEKKVTISKDDQDTKDKLEQLEKRVEAQRLKIEELQARKQQEYDPADEMSLPERHDSEDEQELPLKRVFVKRNKSVYDEEQEYNDADAKGEDKEADKVDTADKPKEKEAKKVVYIKTEAPSEVEDMNRELSSILESTDNVVKMQENVLSNLTEISGIETETAECQKPEEVQEQISEEMEQEGKSEGVKMESLTQEAEAEAQPMEMEVEQAEVAEQVQVTEEQQMSESTDIFETSNAIETSIEQKTNLEDSVVALSQTNETINLNDTNESQDSLENELQKIAG